MAIPLSKKLIILDRDGTINQDRDDFVKTVDEWIPIPKAMQAIADLTHAGFCVVVVTNQSGVGRGLFDVAVLNAMHEKMKHLVALEGGHIDAVFFCPHTPEDACCCRKPLPGLFQQVAEHYGVSLDGVPAVGDSLRDLEAAFAVDAQPVLVRTGKGLRTEAKGNLPSGTIVFDDLYAFTQFLLSKNEVMSTH